MGVIYTKEVVKCYKSSFSPSPSFPSLYPISLPQHMQWDWKTEKRKFLSFHGELKTKEGKFQDMGFSHYVMDFEWQLPFTKAAPWRQRKNAPLPLHSLELCEGTQTFWLDILFPAFLRTQDTIETVIHKSEKCTVWRKEQGWLLVLWKNRGEGFRKLKLWGFIKQQGLRRSRLYVLTKLLLLHCPFFHHFFFLLTSFSFWKNHFRPENIMEKGKGEKGL